jgi:8-oxo-dGTP pyrophosphatase MutT (NUDIX family)
MRGMTGGISIQSVTRLDLRFAPRRWAFAQERRAEIDAHFARLQRDKPVWNGRVLLMHEHALTGDMLRGDWLETDFASFLAWRDWGFPDPAMCNCFAAAALQGSDGGFVLGVMGARTSNAGKIYFPSGTPEPGDVADGRVDLEASVRRELLEETGIAAEDLDVASGWDVVTAGPRIALMKPMRAKEDAAALRERVRAYLTSDPEAELSDIHVARRPADLHPAMPDFVVAYLGARWNVLAKGGGGR